MARNKLPTNETERREMRARTRAADSDPERTSSEAIFGREEGSSTGEAADKLGDDATAGDQASSGDDGSDNDLTEPSLDDWLNAEHARPDSPGETEDGLSELEEETRRQAEDRRLQ